MKSSPQTLKNQMAKQLASVYLVSGDEPLQLMETCDDIRHAAREKGFIDREIFHIDKKFDWSDLFASTCTMSLFSHLRFIELRIGNGKLGDKGSKALMELLGDLPQDTILLVISTKLDAATQRTKWHKCLESVGVTVQIWPVEANRLAPWIQQRMQSKGLQPTREAIQILVERGEGNLLAIAQEIEKLLLLDQQEKITAEDVVQSVSDSARYDIYGFVDTCLQGDVRRVVRMLEGLRGEGIEAILVLWVLSREIRSLAQMSRQLTKTASIDQVINKNRVWPKRKALVTAGLRRHSAAQWEQLLAQASSIDLTIKGLAAGKVWDQLLQLCLELAGLRLFTKSAGSNF
jgi:DNA polymerase-3 subunit delta